MSEEAAVPPATSHVFARYLDWDYPIIEQGEGVWLRTADGRRVLDGCSGGDMTVCLGYGVRSVVDAWAAQAERLPYFYDAQFANEQSERLARRVLEEIAPSMGRVRFVSGGSEANETALRIARAYHVARGDAERWLVISPAQAYHGSTMATLALSGRRTGIQGPFDPYLPKFLHMGPSSWRRDPTGEEALSTLDQIIDEQGSQSVAAFFCEPISAAAYPAYSPPEAFWRGLDERRRQHGFLVCFDEVVTGLGRVGSRLAADDLPLAPDIVTLGKGLGAGYAPLAAALCTDEVARVVESGFPEFDWGHTWDGAPSTCAVGNAVLDEIVSGGYLSSVKVRGPRLLDAVRDAVGSSPVVREVRGRGFLIGIELVDPRDGESILPDEVDAGAMMDAACWEEGLLATSTHPNADGFTGDQTLLAPAFVISDGEIGELADRLRKAMLRVEKEIAAALGSAGT